MSCFSFKGFFFIFSFYKIREQKSRTKGGIGTGGSGEVAVKGGKRLNMMQKVYTYM
jgi:hypothetical protein